MIEITPFNQEPARLRQAFGHFPSGVVAVAALDGTEPLGMAITSFTPVSIEPPLVSFCAQLSSRTWPRLRSSDKLGLSVLAQGHDDIALSLAAKEGDRFAAFAWDATPQGAVVVHGASAWLQCTLYDEITAGDHLLVLLEVVGLETRTSHAPLVFHRSRFRTLAVAG